MTWYECLDIRGSFEVTVSFLVFVWFLSMFSLYKAKQSSAEWFVSSFVLSFRSVLALLSSCSFSGVFLHFFINFNDVHWNLHASFTEIVFRNMRQGYKSTFDLLLSFGISSGLRLACWSKVSLFSFSLLFLDCCVWQVSFQKMSFFVVMQYFTLFLKLTCCSLF